MAEEVFNCVQCGIRYLEVENKVLEGACAFHAEHNWDRYPKCCGSYQECKKGAHRPTHHCDYRYGNFFKMFADINGYTDTKDVWAEVKDTNLSTSKEQNAWAGKLLRWKSRANRIDEDLLAVKVGNINSDKYFFKLYTTKDLDEIGQSGKTEIFRNSESNSTYALARFIIVDGLVSGIHLEAMESTSSKPHCVEVRFTAFPLEKQGEPVTISEGGMALFNPASDYVLPAIKRSGADLPPKPSRAVRHKEFPTQGRLNMKIKGSEIKANERNNPKADNFTGKLNLININKGKDAEAIVFTDCICEWRLVGNQEWKPVDHLDIERNFSAYPMTNIELNYTVRIDDPTKCVGWFNRSWLGRNQPVRFRFTFEDIEGMTSSQVVEYIFKPENYYVAEATDALFLNVDNLGLLTRTVLRGKNVYKEEYPDGGVVSVDGNEFNAEKLTKLVFKAKTENLFEQILFERTEETYTKTAWALIDDNTNRVYAIKMLVTDQYSAALGYFLAPLYGKPTKETKPIKPAAEVISFPEKTGYPAQEYVQDDEFDDRLIPCEKHITGGNAAVSLDANSLETLNRLNENMKKMADSLDRFESVDQGIARLAESFEKLVVILGKK